MPSTRLRPGENLDKALRILKKKVDKEAILKTVKSKQFYSKPSIRERAKSKAALKYKKR